MEFQEFLQTRPRYENLVILEEWGDKEKIEKRVVQFGLRTEGRVLIYNTETKYVTENSIFKSNRGYSILLTKRKIAYEKFTRKETT